jgi:hypothetical protein
MTNLSKLLKNKISSFMDNHENIGFYFSRPFWDTIRIGKTDKEWSETLDFLLDWSAEIKSRDMDPFEYTVEIGSYTVWIANYPYAYGNKFCFIEGGKASGLPTRRVQYKLYKAIKAAKRKK